MIVVDTSAWVELLRKTESRTHRTLRGLIQEKPSELAITETVVMELLAGASGSQARGLRSRLLAFEILTLEGLAGFEQAAAIYRRCRAAGTQLRGLSDCLIAVPAIRTGAAVLHRDDDFETIAAHTELETLKG
jgi:predicted nucleic acid-binding protein